MFDIKKQVLPIFNKTVSNVLESPLAEIMRENSEEKIDENRIKIDIYNDYIYGLPFPIQTEKSTLSATILCNPGNRNLNVNYFRDFNDSFRATFQDRLMTVLSSEYKLIDPSTLIELINYVVGATPRENSYLFGKEELEVNNMALERNSIEGIKSWKKILKDYEKLTEDKEIYNVPWEEIIGFGGEYLDFNQMSSELCRVAFYYSAGSNEDLCTEPSRNETEEDVSSLLQDDEKIMINGLNMSFDFNNLLECQMDYESRNNRSSYKFLYRMETNETSYSLKNFSFFVE